MWRRVGWLWAGAVAVAACSGGGETNETRCETVAECVEPRPLGATCGSDSDCASGFCVDAVCCDTACTDACSSCAGAKTNAEEGRCAFVTAGTDPDEECPSRACDGMGACLAPNGAGCTAPGECASGHCVDAVCCEGPCQGAQATTSCASGSCVITSCEEGFCDLDGDPESGCERELDDDPACSAAVDLGTLSGDTDAEIITHSAQGDAWFLVHVAENDFTSTAHDLGVSITLEVPAGTDYDLHVRCDDCMSADESAIEIGAVDEVVTMRWGEPIIFNNFPANTDTGRDLIIEVRYWSANSCAPYTLEIEGNVLTGPKTCPDK